MLPSRPLRTDVVMVCGEEVKIRELTAGEAYEVAKLVQADDLEQANRVLIAYGTDTAQDEVDVWWETAPKGDAERLCEALYNLAALTEEAPKSG